MKYLPFLLAIILISACSDKECYKCKDGNATFEISDQFPSGIDIQIPNFAVEGQETIPLFSFYRLDNNPVSISDAFLTLTGENSELLFEGDATSFIVYKSSIEIPVSLLYSKDQWVEGQIYFDFSSIDSVTGYPFSMEGSFLFMSCETYLDPDTEIEGRDDCRDSRNTNEWSNGDYGC